MFSSKESLQREDLIKRHWARPREDGNSNSWLRWLFQSAMARSGGRLINKEQLEMPGTGQRRPASQPGDAAQLPTGELLLAWHTDTFPTKFQRLKQLAESAGMKRHQTGAQGWSQRKALFLKKKCQVLGKERKENRILSRKHPSASYLGWNVKKWVHFICAIKNREQAQAESWPTLHEALQCFSASVS